MGDWLHGFCDGCTVLGCGVQAKRLILGEFGIGEDRLHLHQMVAHGGTRADGIVGTQGCINGAMFVDRGVLTANQAGALAELIEERREHAGP